ARDQANLQERCPEDCGIRRQAHVGKTGDIVAEPDCRTIHGGNQGYFQSPKTLDDAMDAIAITLANVHAGASKGAAAFAHRLDVATGRKGRTSTSQDCATH